MSHEEARQFIDQATQSIQSGQYQTALDLLDRSIALDSSDTEAYVLRGVALSQLRQSDAAKEAFQTAISLAPHNSKAFYNFAVHLYGEGAKAEALEMAREAVRVDPSHSSAAEFVTRLERETGAAHMVEPPPAIRPPDSAGTGETPFAPPDPNAGYYRAGYYDYATPVHSLAFIEQMGKWWDRVGWSLGVLGLLAFIYNAYKIANIWPDIMAQLNNKQPYPMTDAFSAGNLTLSLLVDGLYLLIIIWMVFELVDRRGNWFWIVPTILGCCCWVHFLVLMIYIPFGRQSR